MSHRIPQFARKAAYAVIAVLVALVAVCAQPREALAADEWVVFDDTSYYLKADDTFARNEWVNVGNSWYFFGDDGAMLFYWTNFFDMWFFNYADGTPYTGLAYFFGDWFYFDDFGRLILDEWVSWGDYWFHFDAYGRAAVDCWIEYEGDWFHFDEYGRMQTGWQYLEGTYFYFNEDGTLLINGWAPYEGIYYRTTSYGTVSYSTYPVKVVERNVTTSEGTVKGQFFVPQGVKSAPVAIIAHGLGGVSMYYWGTAIELAGMGVASYTFDFIGGSPLTTSGGSFQKMTIDSEVTQLNAIVSTVRTWSGVNSRRVFIAGHSQGGLVGTLVAAKRNDLAGLILLAPAYDLGERVRDMYSSLAEVGDTFTLLGFELGHCYAESVWDIYADEVVESYSGPTLIVQGLQDTVVSPRVSFRAKEIWGDSCTLVIDRDGTHNTVALNSSSAVNHMYDFIQEHESSSSSWWSFGGWSWPWGGF